MPDNQRTFGRETVCLREAQELMNRVMTQLQPTGQIFDGSPSFDRQRDAVVLLASELGSQRFNACMARPNQTQRRR